MMADGRHPWTVHRSLGAITEAEKRFAAIADPPWPERRAAVPETAPYPPELDVVIAGRYVAVVWEPPHREDVLALPGGWVDGRQ